MSVSTNESTKTSVSLLEWFSGFRQFARREALVLFLLGFSAGLPYLLIASGTLSALLKDSGLDYRAIGFFAWVGLMFSIKFMWAPFVDRLRFPVLCRLLGQRRGWLLASQIGIAAGLVMMASISPLEQTSLLALVAVFVAFCSATQDVCIDAYRIQAVSSDLQGVVTSAYMTGYRVAILVAGAGALLIADDFNWQVSYQIMGALMGVGIITVLWIKEPKAAQIFTEQSYAPAMKWGQHKFPKASERSHFFLARFWVHVIEPFAEMFLRFRSGIILLLAVVLLYRVSDIVMGNMATPFYLALGYTKTEIAWVSKFFGLFMTILGSAIGGVLVLKKGLFPSMWICLLSVVLTNLLFALLASVGSECTEVDQGCVSLWWLGAVISADNLAAGASQVAFIAFLSHQVNVTYSASQYALLSSAMTLLGKFVSGFSGVVVEDFGFGVFFVYISCWGIPSLIVLSLLRRFQPQCFAKPQVNHDLS